MFQSLLSSIFGCTHRRTTFPQTPARRGATYSPHAVRSGTYVVCLDCGKEFAYDWSEMRIGQLVEAPVAQAETQPSFR